MPLVASAVLAYAAGLLAGLGDARGWSIAALAIVVALAADNRLLLAALGIAGVASGDAHRVTLTRCAETLAVRAEWLVTLHADAVPGAFVRGKAWCGARVGIAVTNGDARAGATVRVTGAPGRGNATPLMTEGRVLTTRPPSPWARWRGTIGDGVDATFGSRAPLVRALLIADMREIAPSVRETFAAAGLSHMLSVSGLHVGLIAAAILLVAQIVGAGRSRAEMVTVAATAGYVVLIGAPLPAVRSALMLGAASLSRLTQRPTSPWATLAIGAGLPLVDPSAIADVGYQLSVVGMVALVSAGALGRRWEWLGAGGWRGTLYRSLATSVLATLFTAPLVAAVFGRISLVAPLTNLVAVPVVALLQPMLFLGALLLPLGAAARFVADACEPLMLALDAIASAGAALPGAAVPIVTDRLTLALACVVVAALAVACASRSAGRALVLAAGCVAFVAWRPMLPGGPGVTELHMLDVGQGDALALRTARGRWVLFDAGREWQGGDAGRRTLVPYVAARRGRVHAFVLSHPHADHVGGAASVLRGLRPAFYFDPAYAGGSRPYGQSLLAAREARVSWRRVRPGDSLVVDEAVITFLAPDSAWTEGLSDPNEASAVARIRVGQVTMLMTGDAEAGEERWLLDHRRSDLRADLLKVAHHGSGTSSTAAFLDAVQPRAALISVGAGNLYGHPDPAVLTALARRGAVVLRSDRDGAVVARTDGRRLELETRGERWTLPPRALPKPLPQGQF